jgi:hypothetical protein
LLFPEEMNTALAAVNVRIICDLQEEGKLGAESMRVEGTPPEHHARVLHMQCGNLVVCKNPIYNPKDAGVFPQD